MEIRNLVFDIGGIITDDGDGPLEEVLGLSQAEINELNRMIYKTPQWREGVMLGRMSQEEYARELIDKYPVRKNEIEKLLLPQYQAEVLPILQDNLSYIKKLKASDRYGLYILSNLTEATYGYLEEILALFDGGAYSFQEHIKKPDPKFYQILFSRYELKPEECLFFDDRKANIEAGEALGMRGIVIKSTQDLQSLSLL